MGADQFDDGPPPRSIAWQIIAGEEDPKKRMEEAAGYPGLVQDHVRIFTENEDMQIQRLRHRARRLAIKAKDGATPTERRAAQQDLDDLRYQCQGWILERMRAG